MTTNEESENQRLRGALAFIATQDHFDRAARDFANRCLSKIYGREESLAEQDAQASNLVDSAFAMDAFQRGPVTSQPAIVLHFMLRVYEDAAGATEEAFLSSPSTTTECHALALDKAIRAVNSLRSALAGVRIGGRLVLNEKALRDDYEARLAGTKALDAKP